MGNGRKSDGRVCLLWLPVVRPGHKTGRPRRLMRWSGRCLPIVAAGWRSLRRRQTGADRARRAASDCRGDAVAGPKRSCGKARIRETPARRLVSVANRPCETGVAEFSSARHGPDRRRDLASYRATESQTVSEWSDIRFRPTQRVGRHSTGTAVGFARESEAPWRDSCSEHAYQERRQRRRCYETLRPAADSVKKSGYSAGRVVLEFSQASLPDRPTGVVPHFAVTPDWSEKGRFRRHLPRTLADAARELSLLIGASGHPGAGSNQRDLIARELRLVAVNYAEYTHRS